ncbi:hypothetical protein CCY99_07555 [Helicobacter sp. 16-1353]|uniref:metallophosphoesterase n=1 Tax=Helicobacter sp. 16-1353 TaxID=2004996 RepID=UPI000DCF1DAA|nr:metallophosphoesterase [Helicobacter sp. 16-1353]RAX52239.1 hypothetical protein CCY99_07555 [Helicobacter sp. 16-1353]
MSTFLIVSLCVFLIFHIISYHFLIKPMLRNLSLRYRILGILLLILNFILIIIFMVTRRFDVPDSIILLLSISILTTLLLFSAALVNIIFLILAKFIKGFPAILISRILFAVAIIGVGFGIYGASKMPNITTQTIEIKNLKKDMSILVISDLHLSKLITSKKVEKIISLANSTNPDIIVLLGDIIDDREENIRDSLDLLKNLKAKYGVYFVLGNHEFISNAYRSLEIIDNLGITTLVNNSVVIDDDINLIGLSDMSGFRFGYLEPDVTKAMQNTIPSLPNIMLSHQPNTIDILDSNIDLLLSGHTHGGQIFPFSFIVYLANPFLSGLKTINDIQIYITKGASVAVTYGRVGAESEINLITLKGVR